LIPSQQCHQLGTTPSTSEPFGGHFISKTQQTIFLKSELGAGRVAQVVACLPTRHKTLNLNPSTTKKKKSEVMGWEKLGPGIRGANNFDFCHN
jgi:hypothetical protein